MSITEVCVRTPKVVRKPHRGFSFPNGAKCIVVEDEDCKLPAAAVTMYVGTNQDPPQLPGLAHFCEHMLFMGTEKFPNEDEFDKFISRNGGQSNAWTAHESTTFYYTVGDDVFAEALDRFLEFFVAPSFNESAVEREVLAVHSEDEKNHSVDYWRLDELMRTLIDERHPRSRYGNGNKTTLWDEPRAKGIDVRQELLKFYHQYYVAEAFSIVVYSRHAAETLLPTIEHQLSRMNSGARATNHFVPRSLSDERQCHFPPTSMLRWYNINCVKKLRSVRVMFPYHSPREGRVADPSGYASHVLGHESEGSVLSVLKNKGFATALTAGSSSPVDDDDGLFYIDVSLTPAGFRSVMEVLDILYQGIDLLRSNEGDDHIDGRVYQQMMEENTLSFEMSDMKKSEAHSADLSFYIHDSTSLESCWLEQHVATVANPRASFEMMSKYLVPDNSFILMLWDSFPVTVDAPVTAVTQDGSDDDDETDEEVEISDEAEKRKAADELFNSLPEFAKVPCNRLTRFHKAAYGVATIPDEALERWRSVSWALDCGIELPSLNRYIATSFEVHPPLAVLEDPPLYIPSSFGDTFVKLATKEFPIPKTAVGLDITTDVAYASPTNRFFCRVMVGILQHALTSIAYVGELAALMNDIHPMHGGVGIGVVGPSHKLVEFFLAVVARSLDAATLKGTREVFMNISEAALRTVESLRTEQPYTVTADRTNSVLVERHFTFDDIIPAARLAHKDHELYSRFVDDYLSKLSFTAVYCGNVRCKEDAYDQFVMPLNNLFEAVGQPLPVPQRDIRPYYNARLLNDPQQKMKVTVKEFPTFSPADPNSAVSLDFAIGVECPATRVIADCFVKLISSKFFNALRTKETLGYIVYSRSTSLHRLALIKFGVQSAVDGVDGLYLLSRILAFLEACEAQWDSVCTVEALHAVVQAQIRVREERPTSIRSVAQQLMSDSLHPCGFTRNRDELALLRSGTTVTLTSVRSFFLSFVANSSTSRRALAVIVQSAKYSSDVEARRLDLHAASTWTPPQRISVDKDDAITTEAQADDDITLPAAVLGPVQLEFIDDVAVWASAAPFEVLTYVPAKYCKYLGS